MFAESPANNAPTRPQRGARERAAAGSGNEHKRGEAVARQIEVDLLAAGTPAGAVFASEAELLIRYGVSRSILREALRVVEHLGVARMRRGPGGGLVASVPDPSAVETAVTVYLTFQQASLRDVLETRSPIEGAAARLAATRRNETDLANLLAQSESDHTGILSDDSELHIAIARMTANPVLELFVELLARVTRLYQATRMPAGRRQSGASSAHRAHRRIVQAVAEGDGDAAERRIVRHLDQTQAFVTPRQLDKTLGFVEALSSGPSESGRLAPIVANRIYSEVVARGWPVGELLGSEADLIAQHDVGRSVLREALRLLEFNRIVSTRRGPGGGIFVAAPSQAATVGAMAVYLESKGITPQQLFEVRQALEVAAVKMAVATLDETGASLLKQALEREQEVEDRRHVGHELHGRIAEITGNSVLHLFMNALTRLAEIHTVTTETGLGMTTGEAARAMRHVHVGIVEAILDRDSDTALARMRRHLVALTPLQR